MRDIMEDLGESFKRAMIEQGTFWRWIAVGVLWLLALSSWALGIIASVEGFGLQGASIITSGVTFLIVSGTVIFTFATIDISKENN